VAALTKVPGIGKKGAERMVLELRDKIGLPGAVIDGVPAPAPSGAAVWRAQVTEALVGLGWSAKQADDAVERVAGAAGESPNVSEMLRAALRELGR
jgi:Holliday junction DNA helicase RuvA